MKSRIGTSRTAVLQAASCVLVAVLAGAGCHHAIPPTAQVGLAADAGVTPTPRASSSPTSLGAPRPGPGEYLGSSVASSADGRTLAVGAPGDTTGARAVDGGPGPALGRGVGAVYVFGRSSSGWSLDSFLKAPNPAANAAFGYRVDLSADGRVLVVGAYGESSGDRSSGAVYVFERAGKDWEARARLKASDSMAGDAFGSVVALSDDGTTLAAARFPAVSSGEAEGVAPRRNAVYVFRRGAGMWREEAILESPSADPYTTFGKSVSLSGDGATLAVGDPSAGSGARAKGVVTVFSREPGGWAPVASLVPGGDAPTRNFGASVSLSGAGDTVVVGAPALEAGRVVVFRRNGREWSRTAVLENPTREAEALFGHSVHLSAAGDRLAIGAPGIDRAYLFERGAHDWRLRATLREPKAARPTEFGGAIAVSGDGSTIAVGAKLESRGARDSGAVFIFAE